MRKRVQKHDEHVLVEPFRDDFAGREEPDIYEVLECARPYLPREGAFGEMVLNVGKVVYLAKKGAAGIIDISPFTCMNGIVCEAIYPRISRDLGGSADPQFLLRRHAVGPGSGSGSVHGVGADLPEESGVGKRRGYACSMRGPVFMTSSKQRATCSQEKLAFTISQAARDLTRAEFGDWREVRDSGRRSACGTIGEPDIVRRIDGEALGADR